MSALVGDTEMSPRRGATPPAGWVDKLPSAGEGLTRWWLASAAATGYDSAASRYVTISRCDLLKLIFSMHTCHLCTAVSQVT